MGCIMTPMPNHLSTLKTTPQPCGEHHSKTIKTTQNSVGIRKRGSVGMEQMRIGVEMVRLSGLVG